jgi:hypothetical protein
VGLDRVDGALVVGFVLATLLGVFYVATRRQVVRVSSPSAHIDVELKGAKGDEAIGIVETIEHAKHAWHERARGGRGPL